MPLPRSVTRIKDEGVVFISSVDRVSYTMKELCRAALRDVGKFVCITASKRAQKLRGLDHGKSMRVIAHKIVKPYKGPSFQYWVKHKYEKHPNMQVGIKHNTWYGVEQELGSSKMKKLGILSNTVYDNIPTIVKIESQYLSALEDEARALELISEKDYEGSGVE